MIWNLCAKWYFLEDLIKNISFWNLNIYLGSILLKAFSFNTLVEQISLFDKVVYQTWSIMLDSLLNMCTHMCLCVLTTHSILYVNASYETTLVLTLGISVRPSPSQSIPVIQTFLCMTFVQWSNKLHIWYQMKFIWCKNCFLKAYLQTYFLHDL